MNLTVREIALMHGVSERQIQRYVSTGYQGIKLPAQRTGKRLTITDTDFALWLIKCGFEREPAVVAKPAIPQVSAPVPEIAQPDPAPAFPEWPRPADPLHGVLTNCPHERSCNHPDPRAVAAHMQLQAELQAARIRGNPHVEENT